MGKKKKSDITNVGSPSGKVKGRFTKAEDDFLKKNYRLMTDRQIANSLNRSVKSIVNRRGKLDLTDKRGNKVSKTEFRNHFMSSLSSSDKATLINKELKSTATYKAIKKVLSPRELRFYEEKYIGFMMDPSIETMTVPEKDALHEMTMCQIQLIRLHGEERACIDSNSQFSRSSDMKNLQDIIQRYQRDLNATRAQRLKNQSDSAINFTNLIKEMKQPELRRELGYEAAMLKYIAERHYNDHYGKNILSGKKYLFDIDSLFIEKEPSNLKGEFTKTENEKTQET